MKKIIALLSIATIFTVAGTVYSETNMPGAPVYELPKNPSKESPSSIYEKNSNKTKKIPNVNIQEELNNLSSASGHPELDSLATQMLKAAENRNNSQMQSYASQLMKKGVTSVCQPQIVAKRTPQCPPIKIQVNGSTKSGSLCALTCYEYDGTTYDVGYCK